MVQDVIRPAVELGRTASAFLPGTAGNAAGLVFDYAGTQYEVKDELERLRHAGLSERTLTKGSAAARRKLERLDNKPTAVLIKCAVLLAAGIAGGWLGLTLLGPALTGILPFGGFLAGLIGTMAAGFLANHLYEGAIESHEQDAVSLAAQCHCKVRDGKGPVTNEEAFAALMAALPAKAQARFEEKLYYAAGTRDFAQALTTREGLKALHGMMDCPNTEELLRVYIPIPLDPRDPHKHVAVQYAELVNCGVLDARTIIMEPDQIASITRRYYMESMVRNNTQATGGSAPAVPQQQFPVNGRVARQQEL